MTEILALATDSNGCQVTAEETRRYLAAHVPPRLVERFESRVEKSRVKTRRLVKPLRELTRLTSLEERQALYESEAPAAAERVAQSALHSANLTADDVHVLIVASSTGQVIPTLDVRLATALGLRAGTKTVSLNGLGCSGGVRGLDLAASLLLGGGSQRAALVVSVEVCSIWLQTAEPSPQDVLSSIVFGDGAAALMIGASQGRRPEVIAHQSVLWPASLDARGARLTTTGWRHFSSPLLSRCVRSHLRPTVEAFLAANGLHAADLDFHAVNPSDPHLVELIVSLLDLPPGALLAPMDLWENRANTLSAGPFYLLEQVQSVVSPEEGDLGLLLVLGPGITCDMSLLRWHGDTSIA